MAKIAGWFAAWVVTFITFGALGGLLAFNMVGGRPAPRTTLTLSYEGVEKVCTVTVLQDGFPVLQKTVHWHACEYQNP